MDSLIATARSNKVATTLAMQDFSQLKKDYGKEQADVTAFILSKAKLALVPFSAFGGGKDSNWYRISVGCCKKEDIENVIHQLEMALAQLQ